MTPQDPLTRAELDERLDRFKMAVIAEMTAQQLQQDTAFNLGLRSLREDLTGGLDGIRADLREFVTKEYLLARLSPVQLVAYGMVGMLAFLLTGLLAGVMAKR